MAMNLDSAAAAHIVSSGGLTQQSEAASVLASPPAVKNNVLKDRLLELWSWVRISACTVQSLAEAAEMDGLAHPDIQQLSKMGSHGLHSGNVRRDLVRQDVNGLCVVKLMVLDLHFAGKRWSCHYAEAKYDFSSGCIADHLR